jgi:hypothetical protein
MQDLNKPQLEVGDKVRIDWPRTRWDNRQGRLHELRNEPGQLSQGLVLLDGIAVRIPVKNLKTSSTEATSSSATHQGWGRRKHLQ